MPRDAFEIDVDANGILNVSAQDESITISNEKGLSSQGKVCMRQTHPVFMGAQRGQSRVTERATAGGLRHDRRGL